MLIFSQIDLSELNIPDKGCSVDAEIASLYLHDTLVRFNWIILNMTCNWLCSFNQNFDWALLKFENIRFMPVLLDHTLNQLNPIENK